MSILREATPGATGHAALADLAEGVSTADPADPIGILERQAASRVRELVPLRYTRMLVSPFTFYRGVAAVMAGDLGFRPSSGLLVQLCGDAHLSNFGLFGSPELGCSSTSMTSTRPTPAGSSGTSSGWRRVWW